MERNTGKVMVLLDVTIKTRRYQTGKKILFSPVPETDRETLGSDLPPTHKAAVAKHIRRF
jgi:hypothetical protein